MQRRMTDCRSRCRTGFTLIEMLVATTLVVMMMLMFAQIYTAAIRSLNDQQALARNDQRMRSIDQTLRSDLLRASFRQIPGSRGIVPLVQGDSVHPTQKGYFYLSVNDRDNVLDNVLQFTMLVAPDNRAPHQTPFYGRCIGAGYPNALENHPDDDDGESGNGVGMSRGAEVSYFVRGGNLYRRVLLLRDPSVGTVQYGPQPVNPAGLPIITDEVARAQFRGSFYQRYDYAAYGDATAGGLMFLGLPALENYGGTTAPGAALGIPFYRFGFSTSTGRPVEFDSAGVFFGRMTHAETGANECVWPAAASGYLDQSNNPAPVTSPNPINSGAISYNSTTNRLTVDGTPLYDTTRINEDLLLNNVEAFDIEVWDPADDSFVQLGRGTQFNAAARINSVYGPRTAASGGNWVFDTGHPSFWNDNPFTLLGTRLGYRPASNRYSEDANGNGSLDMGEDTNSDGNLNTPTLPTLAAYYWRPSTVYRPVSEDANRDNILSGAEDFNGNSFFESNVVFRPDDRSQSIGYRCVRSGEDRNGNLILDGAETDVTGDGVPDDLNNNGRIDLSEDSDSDSSLDFGATGTVPPAWPTTPGVQVQDGGVTWEAFDNRIGLEMIRITIRTRDTTTGNPRQFSLTHSFVEPPPGK
jgi:type II secretory pathway pseudopilin PulG